MASKTAPEINETPEPSEYAVTLDEFLSEIPQARVETKAGFTRLCKKQGITGNKMRSEWQNLLTLFQTQPTSTTWAEWVKKGGK